MWRLFILILAFASCCASPGSLEVVNDDELVNLFRSEKFVVVLFTKKDCESCEVLEKELTSLREDLVDALNAWVVKAVSSSMVKLYSPTKEPALVFFRHGVPLLYDGPINDELILHTFTDNKEPVVKELNDNTFEHLTQASTGATTGDWLVMFYSDNCVDCQRLQARWEAVGAKLKTRMNVARVNKGAAGAATGRRFGVQEVPSFILFRQGRLYRYQIPKYDVTSFASFATDWYKNAKAEKIPPPKSPFDDFTQMIADYLRENPWIFWVGFASFVIGLIFSLIQKRRSKSVSKTKSDSKSDSKSSKESSKKSK
ncbi:thioredoxin domain-containing protein [Frankliniella occidentalis]|uniref:Thioredoxin domain-containing protein n=1 Tax=Frankliniella occidentalis TaxID=133901 RepID=A0A6J1TKJ1_FRAOC|nr:thioredoxin domain-containing protein [Frankliniella occidentalis]